MHQTTLQVRLNSEIQHITLQVFLIAINNYIVSHTKPLNFTHHIPLLGLNPPSDIFSEGVGKIKTARSAQAIHHAHRGKIV